MACFALEVIRASHDDAEIVGFGEANITGADTWTASVESQLEAFSATQHLNNIWTLLVLGII